MVNDLAQYRIKGTNEVIEMKRLFLIDPVFPRIVVGKLLSDGSMQRVYDVQLEPLEVKQWPAVDLNPQP